MHLKDRLYQNWSK